MNLVPWQPPTFLRSCQEIDLWNAILSYRDCPLSQEGWNAAFTFSAIDPPDPATPALLIQPDQGPRFAAVIRSFPFAAMFDADLEMADVHQLPHALRSCLEEGVVSTLWRAIPDNRMGDVRIAATGNLKSVVSQIAPGESAGKTPSELPGELQWLSISIEDIAPEPVTVLVGLPAGSLVSVIAGGAIAPAAVDRGLAQVLVTEASYTLGSLPITFDELAGLGPGDLVMLPEVPPDLVLLRAQGRSHAFRLINEDWIFLGREVTERYRPGPGTIERTSTMSQEHDPSEERAEQQVAGLQELGVVVDFDLGRLSVPLAQVQAWQPGAIVPLEPPALNAGVEVAIRANGQMIGIGDLVRIDDRVGVRITRLLSKTG
jgi:flagellar motor switch/type III secretory pathway protein FliN